MKTLKITSICFSFLYLSLNLFATNVQTVDLSEIKNEGRVFFELKNYSSTFHDIIYVIIQDDIIDLEQIEVKIKANGSIEINLVESTNHQGYTIEHGLENDELTKAKLIGREEKELEIATKMKQSEYSNEEIARLTGLAIKDVMSLSSE